MCGSRGCITGPDSPPPTCKSQVAMGFVKESGTNNTREAFEPSGPIASRRMPVQLYVTCVDDLTKNCKDPTDDDFIIRACPAEFKHHFSLIKPPVFKGFRSSYRGSVMYLIWHLMIQWGKS